MFKNKSKIGLSLVAIYIIVAISSIIYSNICSEVYCNFSIIIPAWPWILLLQDYFESNWFIYGLIVLLNIAIVYYIGALITLLIKKIKSSQSK